MKKILFILLTATATQTVYGQSKRAWTLEECVEYAVQNNIDVRLSDQDVQRADYNRDASMANLFPDLSLNGGYNWNFGLNIDPVSNIISRTNRQTGAVSLNSQWVLFDGFRNTNQIHRSRIDYMAAVYRLKSVKNDITINVASAYLQAVLSKEVLVIAREQLRNSDRLAEQTKKRYDAGSVAYGDMLQSLSQLAADEQRVVEAENNVELNLLALAQMLQLADAASFDVADPETELPEGLILARAPEDIYNGAVEVQPVIRAADLNVQSAERSLRISRGQLWPTISLQGQISTSYSDQDMQLTGSTQIVQTIGYWDDGGNHVPVFQELTVPTGVEQKSVGTQIEDNTRQFVGINMSWPIFSRLQRRNDIRFQKFNLEQARLEEERTRNNLRQTIQRAHADARAALKSYTAATKSVEAAEENLKYARVRVEEGAISQYEYENANNNYLAAVSQQLQSKYDYTFKIKVLEFYLNNQF